VVLLEVVFDQIFCGELHFTKGALLSVSARGRRGREERERLHH
jgi:hypothetical protein